MVRFLNREDGQIILRHVIKIGVTIAVLIFIIWAFGPLVYLRFSTVQDAEDLASSVAFEYKMYKNREKAIESAVEKLRLMGYTEEEVALTLPKIEFLPLDALVKTDVRVTVVKIASNSVINYLGALKKYAKVSNTKEANIQSAQKQ